MLSLADEKFELWGKLGTSALNPFQSELGICRRGLAHSGRMWVGQKDRLCARGDELDLELREHCIIPFAGLHLCVQVGLVAEYGF